MSNQSGNVPAVPHSGAWSRIRCCRRPAESVLRHTGPVRAGPAAESGAAGPGGRFPGSPRRRGRRRFRARAGGSRGGLRTGQFRVTEGQLWNITCLDGLSIKHFRFDRVSGAIGDLFHYSRHGGHDGAHGFGQVGAAGEWGHMAIAATFQERHGLPLYTCGCGKRGCVASCFAQFVLQIKPDIIVVGGGLSPISELYSRLPAILSQYLLAGIPPFEIAPAKFGDASGVRGAAIHAAQQLGTGSDPSMELEWTRRTL